MQIKNTIMAFIPRLIILLVVIWTYFNYGPIHAGILVLIPVVSRVIDKLNPKTTYTPTPLTRDFLKSIDDSGEYADGSYNEDRKRFKKRWSLK